MFWQVGYEKTSIEELMREMGVAKQSPYDTFGGKRDLYMKALVYYRDVSTGKWSDCSRKSHPSRKALRSFCMAWPAKLPDSMGEHACSSARTCNATHPMLFSQISYVTIRRG